MDRSKEALLNEDTALGCWVCDDVPDEDSERNNEVEVNQIMRSLIPMNSRKKLMSLRKVRI